MQKTAMSPICREPNSTLTWHPRDAAPAVVMGVSGSGKSTVGKALAERLGWEFQEGDTLHPPENIAKMSAEGHQLLGVKPSGAGNRRGHRHCAVIAPGDDDDASMINAPSANPLKGKP
jgi:hypothetical protein